MEQYHATCPPRTGEAFARAEGQARDEPYPFILQIEEPLTDAIHYTEALRLIGHGIIAQDDNGGDAIVALAWETAQRLEKVKKIWNKMRAERRRARALAPRS